ncbi:hypothetical protein ACIBG8_54620 [Nonomuraea sp. NPDC050556]|uniref:hypothetical protein n=1 Tax=Nonomuraea sp. NPDC050556 TaxID=3364369 RepID=UPI0037BC225C
MVEIRTAAADALIEQAKKLGWRVTVDSSAVRHQSRFFAQIGHPTRDSIDLWWKISYPSGRLRFDCATRATDTGVQSTRSRTTAVDWMSE